LEAIPLGGHRIAPGADFDAPGAREHRVA
jgi:hypothetical protein